MRRLGTSFLFTCLVILIFSPLLVMAENWPSWRGPNSNGVSIETGIATRWTKTENVSWRIPLPGPAGSTPIVWQDRIFLTSASENEDDLLLICLNSSGEKLWQKKLGSGNRNARGNEGNCASPSPCTDGKYVWAYVSTGHIGCYDFEGNEIWKGNLEKWYGEFSLYFVMSSSPIVDGDRLYLQLNHSNLSLVDEDAEQKRQEDQESVGLLIALDKMTGEEIWVHERLSDAHSECEHSYASPVLYRDDKQEFIIVHAADYISGHRLTDGSEIWRCGGLNSKARYNPSLRFVATPAIIPGLIVVPSAKNGPVIGLSPSATGRITEQSDSHLWKRNDNTPDVPSPLIHDGLVYLCRENGVLICMSAETGEEVYQRRTHNNRHRSSPIYADGKVYLTSRDGLVTVIKAGRNFEVLAKNEIGEEISASPAIADGTLYLRSYKALYAIRN